MHRACEGLDLVTRLAVRQAGVPLRIGALKPVATAASAAEVPILATVMVVLALAVQTSSRSERQSYKNVSRKAISRINVRNIVSIIATTVDKLTVLVGHRPVIDIIVADVDVAIATCLCGFFQTDTMVCNRIALFCRILTSVSSEIWVATPPTQKSAVVLAVSRAFVGLLLLVIAVSAATTLQLAAACSGLHWRCCYSQ